MVVAKIFAFWAILLLVVVSSYGTIVYESEESNDDDDLRAIRYDIRALSRDMIHYINGLDTSWKVQYPTVD